MLQAAAEEIPTSKEETRGSLAHGLFHAQRCYGKYFHAAQQQTGVSAADLVEEIRVIGLPKKVDPAGGSSGLAWPELQAEIQRKKQ